MTMTIVEFLTARLDEMEARYLAEDERNMRYEFADIAAKWAILAMVQRWIEADQGYPHQRTLCLAGEDVLARLCLPFAGHPDFNPTWRV